MLRMTYNEKECFFVLLVKAAESVEMTGSQLAIIEYFDDIGHRIRDDEEEYVFDIDDIPWDKKSIQDDKVFLQNMIETAKKPETMEKLYSFMRQAPEIINPYFDSFSEMIKSFRPDECDDEKDRGSERAEVFFKRGTGWKACRDEARKLYTAEQGSRGYYQLCEIDKDTYDKLGSDIEGGDTADDLIRKGRSLFEADDDYYTRAYCIIHDEDYYDLAPWAKAKRRYEKTYGTDDDSTPVDA